MEHIQIKNEIVEAVKNSRDINPYDLATIADLNLLSEDQLRKLNLRLKSRKPVRLTKENGPTKGLLKR